MTDFDASRAWLRQPDLFPRFRAPNDGVSLASLDLDEREELLVIERRSVRRGFLMRQAGWHHLIQGTLAGEPYMVSF